MQPELVQMALALFSGQIGPAWAARAHRVRRLYVDLIGPEPPEIPALPLELKPAWDHPRMLPPTPLRPEVLEAAEDLVDAVCRRRFSRLRDLLHDEVWVLWPHGPILRHRRDPLVELLEKRKGQPAPIRIEDRASYTFSELNVALARGIPKLLDALLGARAAILVAVGLSTPAAKLGRILVAMSPDATGKWRSRNLPFGSPDDAHLASVRPSAIDEPSAQIADRIVRCVVLGQSARLGANRNSMMERVLLRAAMSPADDLIRTISRGDHRLGSAEVVFLGSEAHEWRSGAKKLLPPEAVKALVDAAPDTWGRALERFSPVVVSTRLGALDPGSGQVRPTQKALSVLLEVEDRPERKERRLAALLI